MGYKVNGEIVESDGDWSGCPNCDLHNTPLLQWMSYCPMCAQEVNVEIYWPNIDEVKDE